MDKPPPRYHLVKKNGSFDEKNPESRKKQSRSSDLTSNLPTMETKFAFITKEQLLSLNIGQEVEKLYQFLQQKSMGLNLFQRLIIENPQFDWRQFQGSEYLPFLESSFTSPITSYSLQQLRGLRIAAVDGGLGVRDFNGLHITMIKTAVVMYDFTAGESPLILNYPPLTHEANYSLFLDLEPYSSPVGQYLASLRRSIAELLISLEFIRSNINSPDVMILDGSILPPPPPFLNEGKTTNITDLYNTCLTYYYELYDVCEKKQILLIGSVKDTQSCFLCELVQRALPFYFKTYPELSPLRDSGFRDLLGMFTDTEFIFHLLTPNKRSLVFRYDEIRNTTITSRQFAALPYPIYAVYIQISTQDFPLRLEFLESSTGMSSTLRINLIASLVVPLAAVNPQCTLPLPQIEAHLRAHISEDEMDFVIRQLENEYRVKDLEKRFQIPNTSQPIEAPYNFLQPFLSRRHDRLDSFF